MRKILLLLFLFFISVFVKAQQNIPADEPYGKVSDADMQMTSCDFEKDANAEVLIDKAELNYDQQFNVVVEHHKRVKIFSDKGSEFANFKLEFINYENLENISGLQAETINLENGKQVVTKLDRKQIFTRVIDKYRSQTVFTMPAIKAGSVIDIKYTWTTQNDSYIPAWYFQDNIPTRCSELITYIPEFFYFSIQMHSMAPLAVTQHSTDGAYLGTGASAISYVINIDKRVMVNIPSLADEPYMGARRDNLRSMYFQLTRFTPPYGFVNKISDTWGKVGGALGEDENFGGQIKRKLTNEDAIINKAKALKTDDEKINYIFNEVKTTMKWNGEDDWYVIDGTSEAWDKKTGNSTEINLILYRLLKKSGVNAMPMVVSTREHGKVNPFYTFLYQFNRTVVYVPVDSTKKYILDASNKYNTADEIPYDLLNSPGLYLNMDKKTVDLMTPEKKEPVKQTIFVNAEIKPTGKVEGTAVITNESYDRINKVNRYKTDGEKKYIEKMSVDDNSLKIASLKIDNLDVDSLPLIENINFDLDLTGTDANYIYFNPNMFSSAPKNPFMSETRNTDIDLGYINSVVFRSIYKIPDGYKVDAMPKDVNMTMPDASVSFKRTVANEDGTIAVHYTINFKKWLYYKVNYADLHEFIKRMYELLNEQIVLKKS